MIDKREEFRARIGKSGILSLDMWKLYLLNFDQFIFLEVEAEIWNSYKKWFLKEEVSVAIAKNEARTMGRKSR